MFLPRPPAIARRNSAPSRCPNVVLCDRESGYRRWSVVMQQDHRAGHRGGRHLHLFGPVVHLLLGPLRPFSRRCREQLHGAFADKFRQRVRPRRPDCQPSDFRRCALRFESRRTGPRGRRRGRRSPASSPAPQNLAYRADRTPPIERHHPESVAVQWRNRKRPIVLVPIQCFQSRRDRARPFYYA